MSKSDNLFDQARATVVTDIIPTVEIRMCAVCALELPASDMVNLGDSAWYCQEHKPSRGVS